LDGHIAPAAREKLIGYVAAGGPFKLAESTIKSKVVGVAHLMMCMPEYQLA
jgi:hypothetical protein